MKFGNQTNSPQSRLVRRHIFADNVTWQHGSHRIKAGGEWEHLKGTGTYALDAPADITLFSPAEVRQLAPSIAGILPSSFNSLSSILNLPLRTFVFGVGDVKQPPSFQRSRADHDNLLHFYWQDTWKVRPRLTVNFGLAWSFESNALNHDLSKPQFLAPIFGPGGLSPEKHAPFRFTPALGFAWALPDNRTVIRGGGGIYYDTLNIETRLVERAYLGPLGTGYLPLPGAIVPNPIALPGLPAGTPLDLRVPTFFSGSLLSALLPLIRTGAIQQLHVNANNTDLSVRNVDVFKTATDLFVRDFVPAQAQHAQPRPVAGHHVGVARRTDRPSQQHLEYRAGAGAGLVEQETRFGDDRLAREERRLDILVEQAGVVATPGADDDAAFALRRRRMRQASGARQRRGTEQEFTAGVRSGHGGLSPGVDWGSHDGNRRPVDLLQPMWTCSPIAGSGCSGRFWICTITRSLGDRRTCRSTCDPR